MEENNFITVDLQSLELTKYSLSKFKILNYSYKYGQIIYDCVRVYPFSIKTTNLRNVSSNRRKA